MKTLPKGLTGNWLVKVDKEHKYWGKFEGWFNEVSGRGGNWHFMWELYGYISGKFVSTDMKDVESTEYLTLDQWHSIVFPDEVEQSMKGRMYKYVGDNNDEFTTGKEYELQTDSLEEMEAFIDNDGDLNGYHPVNQRNFQLVPLPEEREIIGWKPQDAEKSEILKGALRIAGIEWNDNEGFIEVRSKIYYTISSAGLLMKLCTPVYKEKEKTLEEEVKATVGKHWGKCGFGELVTDLVTLINQSK